MDFSTVKIIPSSLFLESTASLRFLSSSSYCLASLTALSISASERFEDEVMVMFCDLPVPMSFAETFTMPFASISKVTSICGTPRGAGAMPVSSNLPSVLLSFANSLSPCRMCISTWV